MATFIREDRVPVSLPVAVRVLEERFPEFAYSERRLRTMVQNGLVPYVREPRGVKGRYGAQRSVSIRVRVQDLVQRFMSWEQC